MHQRPAPTSHAPRTGWRTRARLGTATTLAAAALLAACGGGDVDTDIAGAAGAQAAGATGPSTLSALSAPRPTAQNDVVVMLRSGVAVDAFARAYGVAVVDQFGKRPIYRLRAVTAAAAAALVPRMQADTRVQFAERNDATEAPEARQWDVNWAIWDVNWAIGNGGQSYTAQWAPTALDLPQAHQHSLGAGVRVAVLDTGADLQHPALAGHYLRGANGRVVGRDFVDDDADPSEGGTAADRGWGHGTHVAGLVALTAPQARLMPVRVLDAAGRGNVWVLAEALLYAVDPDGNPNTDDGAHIINLSLGTSASTRLLNTAVELATCSDDDDNEADDDYSDRGFDDDRQRCNLRAGAVVMAAAGNSGSSTDKVYPAAEGAAGQLAVTAFNTSGALPRFANRGAWIQLAAPGEQIISTMPGGGYGVWSGTSMAAPLASGVAALVLAANPDWKPVDVTQRLLDRGRPLCGTPFMRLDAAAAVMDYTPQGGC